MAFSLHFFCFFSRLFSSTLCLFSLENIKFIIYLLFVLVYVYVCTFIWLSFSLSVGECQHFVPHFQFTVFVYSEKHLQIAYWRQRHLFNFHAISTILTRRTVRISESTSRIQKRNSLSRIWLLLPSIDKKIVFALNSYFFDVFAFLSVTNGKITDL